MMDKKNNKEVLFAGLLVGKKAEKFIENENISYAIRKYNRNLVSVMAPKYKISVLSPVKHKGKCPKTEVYRGVKYRYIRYRGQFGRVKQLIQGMKCGFSLKNSFIVADALNIMLATGIAITRRIRKNSLILLVTDIPEDVLNHQKTLYGSFFLHSMRSADGFIFLTEQTNRDYNPKNKPYIIIEGIADEEELDIGKRERACIYAGGLIKKYYITEMADAFNAVAKADECLYIFGHGDSYIKEYIEELSHDSKHVKYMGTVSNAEVIKFEKIAKLLINPRPNIGDYTKYSFPSKLIEYMSSGTPALVNKLDGVPEEYYDKLLLFNGESIEDYKKSIRKALDLSDGQRDQIGRAAREFIVRRNGKQSSLRKMEGLFEALSRKG